MKCTWVLFGVIFINNVASKAINTTNKLPSPTFSDVLHSSSSNPPVPSQNLTFMINYMTVADYEIMSVISNQIKNSSNLWKNVNRGLELTIYILKSKGPVYTFYAHLDKIEILLFRFSNKGKKASSLLNQVQLSLDNAKRMIAQMAGNTDFSTFLTNPSPLQQSKVNALWALYRLSLNQLKSLAAKKYLWRAWNSLLTGGVTQAFDGNLTLAIMKTKEKKLKSQLFSLKIDIYQDTIASAQCSFSSNISGSTIISSTIATHSLSRMQATSKPSFPTESVIGSSNQNVALTKPSSSETVTATSSLIIGSTQRATLTTPSSSVIAIVNPTPIIRSTQSATLTTPISSVIATVNPTLIIGSTQSATLTTPIGSVIATVNPTLVTDSITSNTLTPAETAFNPAFPIPNPSLPSTPSVPSTTLVNNSSAIVEDQEQDDDIGNSSDNLLFSQEKSSSILNFGNNDSDEDDTSGGVSLNLQLQDTLFTIIYLSLPSYYVFYGVAVIINSLYLMM